MPYLTDKNIYDFVIYDVVTHFWSISMPDLPTPLPPHTFHVLLVLSREPAHGYGIKKAVSEESDGRIDLDAGGLYRAIARMEEQGWVEPAAAPATEEDARRKYYALTTEGRRVLTHEASRLTGLAAHPEVIALSAEQAG